MFATAAQLNNTLSRIVAWGNMWQVTVTPHKTKQMSISRAASLLRVYFSGETLTPRDEVELVGVTYDSKLTFRTHTERVTREASGKLASLRNDVALRRQGDEGSIEGAVPLLPEYSKQRALLDKVQERESRLMRAIRAGQEPRLGFLQHLWAVAGLIIMLRVQVHRANPLQDLRQLR